MKKILFRLFGLLILAALAYGGYYAYKQIPQARQSQIPTAKVRQSDIVVKTYARGELQAVRSATLTAPNLFGTVQVTKLAALGSFAKEKDLIVEFDDSELQSRIEEQELALEQLDEQIKKAEADLAIRNNQDKVDLLTAQYAVRRAELQVKQNPLLAEIDQKKNVLALEEATNRLNRLQSDIKSRQAQAEAQLATQGENRNKAVVNLNRERQRLLQVRLLSPMSGLVAIRQNRGNSFTYGQALPDIREGDQLQPGIAVADVLDLSELQVLARIGELDRANLVEGQDVIIRLDALPDVPLRGKIKSMSGTATSNVFSSDPVKKFDVLFTVDMQQLLKALGATPQQIATVLATAEANRNRASTSANRGGGAGGRGAMDPSMIAEMFANGGGRGGRGQRAQGGQGGDAAAGGGFAQGGGRGQRGQGGDAAAGGGFAQGGGRGQRGQDGQGGDAAAGGGFAQGGGRGQRGQRGQGGDAAAGGGFAQGGGRGQRGQGGQGGGRGGRGGGVLRGIGGYTAEELAAATLPPPPEEDDNLNVLLRPGLLADVEIIVEQIPNAIHIPAQALYEREGKPVVFVKEGTRMVPRNVQILKRSENTMIISEGLKAGEEVALQDPEAARSEKKGSSGGGSGGLALPGGKG